MDDVVLLEAANGKCNVILKTAQLQNNATTINMIGQKLQLFLLLRK